MFCKEVTWRNNRRSHQFKLEEIFFQNIKDFKATVRRQKKSSMCFDPDVCNVREPRVLKAINFLTHIYFSSHQALNY